MSENVAINRKEYVRVAFQKSDDKGNVITDYKVFPSNSSELKKGLEDNTFLEDWRGFVTIPYALNPDGMTELFTNPTVLAKACKAYSDLILNSHAAKVLLDTEKNTETNEEEFVIPSGSVDEISLVEQLTAERGSRANPREKYIRMLETLPLSDAQKKQMLKVFDAGASGISDDENEEAA